MIECLDHVVVAVSDLEAATRAYGALLGRAPSWRGTHPAFGTRNTLFRLENTYLELLAAADGGGPLGDTVREALRSREERPFALALGVRNIAEAVPALRAHGIAVTDAADGSGTDDGGRVRRTWRSAFIDEGSVRGLRLFLIEHTSPADLLPPAGVVSDPGSTCDAVDHVVVFCQDIDASHALWTEKLGLREAWRRDFPDRGTRNLGLDLDGIIVELIMRTDRDPSEKPDVFWGSAYRVDSCERAIARLRAASIEVDDARAGLAPGTRVATVRWSRTPTLMLCRG